MWPLTFSPDAADPHNPGNPRTIRHLRNRSTWTPGRPCPHTPPLAKRVHRPNQLAQYATPLTNGHVATLSTMAATTRYRCGTPKKHSHPPANRMQALLEAPAELRSPRPTTAHSNRPHTVRSTHRSVAQFCGQLTGAPPPVQIASRVGMCPATYAPCPRPAAINIYLTTGYAIPARPTVNG